MEDIKLEKIKEKLTHAKDVAADEGHLVAVTLIHAILSIWGNPDEMIDTTIFILQKLKGHEEE